MADDPKPKPQPTSERHEGPTPGGGAYAIAYFLDAERKPCAKEDARYIEIHEYDTSGESIARTWLEAGKDGPADAL